jgi:glycosyltransferase involved in cell wall biosynthesis
MPSATIIIPAYNEEEILSDNVRRLISCLDDDLPGYEIVIVSNGSTDSTAEIGAELAAAHPEVAFLHLSKRGVGRVFREGAMLARSDRIITVDADLTTGVDFIPRAFTLLERCDIVIGSKKMGSQERSAIRIMGSGMFVLCVRILLGLPYGDYSIGAKAYRKEAVMKSLDRVDDGSSYVLDIIYRAWHDGARIMEIPVRCDDARHSHFNLAREGIYRLYRLFGLWFAGRAGVRVGGKGLSE